MSGGVHWRGSREALPHQGVWLSQDLISTLPASHSRELTLRGHQVQRLITEWLWGQLRLVWGLSCWEGQGEGGGTP